MTAAENLDAVEKIVVELGQAIAQRRGHKALGLAKLLRKHPAYSAAHHALVARAYETRLAEMLAAGQTREAEELTRMLAETQPKIAAGLSSETALRAEIFGARGALLARYGADAEVTAAADRIIIRECRDLRALADNPHLPENHPLKAEAVSIVRAWREVEDGKTGGEFQAMLASVGRRSPLVGWRLFVQALAAFYEKRDAEARVCLEKISGAGCVRRLAEALQRMLSGAAPAGGHERAIHARVFGDSIRHHLAEIDALVDKNRFLDARRRMSELSSRPIWQGKTGLLKEIMAQLFAKTGTFPDEDQWDDFDKAMPRVRMNAVEFESDVRGKFRRNMDIPREWERLMQIAQPPFGKLEKALVYNHMARLEIEIGKGPPMEAEYAPDEDLPDAREVYELAREYWRKSAEQHPLRDVYREWARQARVYSDAEAGKVLELWRSDFPDDEQPLLEMISICRAGQNTRKTIDCFDALERVARGRPEVEALRYFIRLDSAARHFAEGNAELAAGELESMPRPAPPFEEAARSTMVLIAALNSGFPGADAVERIVAMRQPATVLFMLSVLQRLCPRFDLEASVKAVFSSIGEQILDYDLMASNYLDLLQVKDAEWGMLKHIFCDQYVVAAFKKTALPSAQLRKIIDGLAVRDHLFSVSSVRLMSWALTGNGIVRNDSETYAFLAYRALLYEGAPSADGEKISLACAYQRMLGSLGTAYKLARKTGRPDCLHFVELIADRTPVYDCYKLEAGRLSDRQAARIVSEESRIYSYEDLPAKLRVKGAGASGFSEKFKRRKKRRARTETDSSQLDLF